MGGKSIILVLFALMMSMAISLDVLASAREQDDKDGEYSVPWTGRRKYILPMGRFLSIAFPFDPQGLIRQRSWRPYWCTLQKIYLKTCCPGTSTWQAWRQMKTLYWCINNSNTSPWLFQSFFRGKVAWQKNNSLHLK